MNFLIQFNDNKIVFQHSVRIVVEEFAFKYYGYPNPQSIVVIASDDESISELQDKLHRRNMQIKELKKKFQINNGAYIVFWERMANSGKLEVTANSPKEAIDKVGFNPKFVKMTAIRITETPLEIGEAK